MCFCWALHPQSLHHGLQMKFFIGWKPKVRALAPLWIPACEPPSLGPVCSVSSYGVRVVRSSTTGTWARTTGFMGIIVIISIGTKYFIQRLGRQGSAGFHPSGSFSFFTGQTSSPSPISTSGAFNLTQPCRNPGRLAVASTEHLLLLV